MKYSDITKGMTVVETATGDKGIVEDTICRYSDTSVWVKWDTGLFWNEANSIEPERAPTQQPSLVNTKIDVQKYADTYGLTLEQSHQEIQPWLFEKGFVWGLAENKILAQDAPYLYCRGNELLHGTDSHRFNVATKEKEITLQRNISVSLSIAPTESHPEHSVELDGKQYTKAQLLDALAKLEGK